MILSKSEFLTIQPYLPFRTIENIIDHGHQHGAEVIQLQGALLFIDVKGFTALSTWLAQVKPRGIEILKETLSRFFTVLIEILRKFGGVVYHFAGDSILVGFRRLEEETEAGCALRASACALQIQGKLGPFSNIQALPGREFSLIAKIGVGIGDYSELLLGSEESWFRYVVVGSACDRAIAAEKSARGGDVIVTDDIWALLPSNKVGKAVEAFHELEAVPGGSQVPGSPFTIPDEEINEDLLSKCARYILPEFVRKLSIGVRGFLGEYRDITSLFVRLDRLDFRDQPGQAAEQLNRYYKYVQREALNFGGIVLETDITDKGIMLFIIFGAPKALENKERRAAQLALKLLQTRHRFPSIRNLQAGITTGVSYFGDVGASFRKSYTALGEFVNLAARLATVEGEGAVLADKRTVAKLSDTFSIEEVEGVTLKGISVAPAVFEIQSTKEHFHPPLVTFKKEIIGRSRELDQLKSGLLKSWHEEGQIWVILGDAGIGKSRLVGAFLDQIRSYKAETLTGLCYSYEQYTTFFPWKELLINFFGMEEEEDRE